MILEDENRESNEIFARAAHNLREPQSRIYNETEVYHTKHLTYPLRIHDKTRHSTLWRSMVCSKEVINRKVYAL